MLIRILYISDNQYCYILLDDFDFKDEEIFPVTRRTNSYYLFIRMTQKNKNKS